MSERVIKFEESYTNDTIWSDILFGNNNYLSSNNISHTRILREGYIISKNNLELNLDKWQRKKNNNILYITGLSGSGKTTIGEKYEKEYNAMLFEIDGIEHNYDSTNNNILSQVFENNKQYKDIVESGYKGISKDEIYKYIYDIFKECHKIMKNDYNNLYIIEGVQLFEFINIDNISNKPIVIIGTSALQSMIRRFKRSSDGGKIDWISELKNEFPQLVRWYIDSQKRLNSFTRKVK